MRWPSLVKGFAQSTPVSVTVEADGVDEDGAPVTAATWSGPCSWQDVSRKVFTSGKVEVESTGCAYIEGDPVPGVSRISGGRVAVFGETREIVQGMKARNPDGSVNYTRLDVR